MPKSNEGFTKNNRKSVYLDYMASIEPNPSSIHSMGMKAKIKLQNARQRVALFLNARPDEIIFTSGGTESNNLAIQGVIYTYFKNTEKLSSSVLGAKLLKVPHIITTNIEHPSVLKTCEMLRDRKLAEVSVVAVETNGIVDPKKIRKEIKANTILISVMYANNEIGTIQPIHEITKEIRHYKKNLTPMPLSLTKRGIGERCIFPIFHTDAVQAVNYLDLNIERLGVDLLSLSGSKVEGAGRVGVLYKKKNVNLAPILGGGDQEEALRPGTENLPEILRFANALEKIKKIRDKEVKRLVKLRDYFFEKILYMQKKNSLCRVVINGDLENRLPNNVNVSFSKIPSELLVIELSERGIMVSAKSACESSQSGGSYVIRALRPDSKEDNGGVRFSFGKKTNKKDIDYTLKILLDILTKLKKWYS